MRTNPIYTDSTMPIQMWPKGKKSCRLQKISPFKDGKVVERAGHQDELAMLKQLGVMP
jgi:hypothetical protein